MARPGPRLESGAMASVEELERLTTAELREMAFKRARHHLDAGFFWRLLEATPAVEAAAGHQDESDVDVLSLSERVRDAINPDSQEEAEAFRPLYIEYLSKHPDEE